MLSFFTTQSYVRFSGEFKLFKKSLGVGNSVVAGLSFSDFTLGDHWDFIQVIK